ncbi:MAG: uroporphyrinogen decarboxylase [Leptospiraceae bacterium]|nr:uroporphyrinogen decarboxylase [Leptospiraceae bacterium]MCP5496700.1 uroporphyrinogen decarboxylase [Leptospiraceae bacterium]
MANENFTNAINRTEQKTPPIWFMRQAGRYHKHYQSLRSKYSFMDLCKEPELAAKVALGPILDFDFDVAILFSDLLFPLESLGMGLAYTDIGPKLGWQLNEINVNRLKPIEEAINGLKFQQDALKLTRELLPQNKSLIGFVGGLWTLFTYAVVGKHDGNLILPKKAIDLRKKFFKVLEDLIIRNIQLQLDGGAEIVMIFDTAAGELSPFDFEEIVIPYIKSISSRFPKKVAYYSKGTSRGHLEKIFPIDGLAGIGFDHRINLTKLLQITTNGFIQGNFDQSLLFQETRDLKKSIMDYLNPILSMDSSERKGWVCSLGHGVLPKTPEDNVKLFIDTVRRVFT